MSAQLGGMETIRAPRLVKTAPPALSGRSFLISQRSPSTIANPALPGGSATFRVEPAKRQAATRARWACIEVRAMVLLHAPCALKGTPPKGPASHFASSARRGRSLSGLHAKYAVLALPPKPGNRVVSFVRACVRPTRGFPILCRFSSKTVAGPQYLLSFVPPGFLFVRGGGPSCSNLDFSPWLVSFIFGDLIFYLWSSSREFLKRVREESS